MDSDQQTLVIVISGAPGVGVSTLAHRLSQILDIRYRVGPGVIIATLRTVFPNHPTLKSIKTHTLEPKVQLHKTLERRARFLSKFFNAVLERYYSRGIPIIFSGSGIFFRFLKHKYITLFVTVAAPPRNIHEKWLHSPSWSRRIFHYPLPLAEKMNQVILTEARKTKTPIIREKNLEGRVRHVLRLLKERGVVFSHKKL